jgi:predicted kinase
MVIIVYGLPGSGKSYFASRLSERLDADYVNSDKVRKELFDKPSYADDEKEEVYKKLFDAMYDNTKSKKPLIIDGTFYQRDIRDNFKLLADDLNINLQWIEIQADEEVIKRRVSKERAYSDANFEVYKLIKQQFVPFKDKHLTLNSTDDNIDQMLKLAMDYIAKASFE